MFAPQAAAGLAGAPWRHWCDENGVPPAVYVAAARGTATDRAVIAAYANQSLNWPRLGKVQGARVLPDGAVARSSAGGWRVPLPPGNTTVITWPDDTFMCTATLSHAATDRVAVGLATDDCAVGLATDDCAVAVRASSHTPSRLAGRFS
mgnify:CR=1 FL=1